jgi:broad specificity phosphatase PhoE
MQHEQVCRIVLVRHGETEANVRGHFAESDEIPLTEAGRLQAQALALRLARDFNPSVLISSTFLRARQTSDILARVLGLKTEVLEGIHERNFGSLRGHPYSRLAQAISADGLPDLNAIDPDKIRTWRPEGGESLEDVRLRAIAALEHLRVRYAGRQILVVCHGAVIRSICSHITGEWSEDYILPNCAAVVIEHTESGWQQPIPFNDSPKV